MVANEACDAERPFKADTNPQGRGAMQWQEHHNSAIRSARSQHTHHGRDAAYANERMVYAHQPIGLLIVGQCRACLLNRFGADLVGKRGRPSGCATCRDVASGEIADCADELQRRVPRHDATNALPPSASQGVRLRHCARRRRLAQVRSAPRARHSASTSRKRHRAKIQKRTRIRAIARIATQASDLAADGNADARRERQVR